MTIDRAVLFVGPSLNSAYAAALPDVDVRPPAARGDVYQAAVEEPRAILLVDGTFENVPTVLHKELMWALAQGIHVFGSSSLGALRAAELDRFGMIGIGQIYEAFRDGKLERDDAVAVLHGPGELGWPLLTRALVDIHATFLEAKNQGVLDDDDRDILNHAAQDVFWRERTYARAIDRAVELGWASEKKHAILDWLVTNDVSQKRSDAITLIEHVASNWEELGKPFAPSFYFENTAAWHSLTVDVEWEHCGLSPAAYDAILRNVRMRGDYESLELEAVLLVLADGPLQSVLPRLGHSDFADAAKRFRQQRGLRRSEDVLNWLATNRLSHFDYTSLVSDQWKLSQLRAIASRGLRTAMVRVLRARGLLQG